MTLALHLATKAKPTCRENTDTLQQQNGDTHTAIFHRKLHKAYPPNINSTEFHKEFTENFTKNSKAR